MTNARTAAQSRNDSWRLAISLALVVAGLCASGRPALAQQELMNLSLSDLLDLNVTSASRRQQRLADVAAAVYVITHDEIRRSGLVNVPELLRLAPGVQVARIDASKWAISIRGFNRRWSDKLLVLVDGRTIYDRMSSGVHWDGVNVMIDDIDRIEIVRGPGGSVWGANAVAGVINILTKSSADTQGGLVRLRAGTQDASGGAARYGGSVGNVTYRTHSQWSRHGHTVLVDSGGAPDGWKALEAGGRIDWDGADDRLTVDVGGQRVHAGFEGPLVGGPVAPPEGWPVRSVPTGVASGYVRTDWTRILGIGRMVDVQAFVDRVDRDDSTEHSSYTTADVEAKYQVTVGARNDLLVGAGYRRTADHFKGSFAVTVTPDRANLSVLNAFAQDELRLWAGRVRLTTGVKVERETLSGWGVQPTLRALWGITDRQQVWGAVSRALRAPARLDQGMRVNVTSFPGEEGMPVVVAVLGNPDYEAEEVRSLEAGYRLERSQFSADASAFLGRHEGMVTFEPLQPIVETIYGRPTLRIGSQFANFMNARTRGIELTGRWASAPWWHVDASYTYFHLEPRPSAESGDEAALTFDGNAPRHQWQVRPAVRVGAILADVALFRVGALKSLEVPGYTRVDARVEWLLRPSLSFSVAGQNLTDARHIEFGGVDNGTTVTLDSRRVEGRLAWTF